MTITLWTRELDGSRLFHSIPETAEVVAPNLVTVETSSGVFAPVVIGQDVNLNGALQFQTASTLESGWSHAANSNIFTFTGSPNHVIIMIMVEADGIGQSVTRASPAIDLFRGTTQIARSSTGYIRDSSGHEESSNTVAIIDYSPGTNPTYEVESIQYALNGGVVNTNVGHFSAKAVSKIQVYGP